LQRETPSRRGLRGLRAFLGVAPVFTLRVLEALRVLDLRRGLQGGHGGHFLELERDRERDDRVLDRERDDRVLDRRVLEALRARGLRGFFSAVQTTLQLVFFGGIYYRIKKKII